jgi:hypothetical protein
MRGEHDEETERSEEDNEINSETKIDQDGCAKVAG